ncbi:Serine/threonine-protein phosphatase 2B catalytic subunit [Hypsizygus marmoreus]|uniref:Serine/threonine-protein phosphatase n=1 Tax=Hypsizygus marmoreus TaxID=39966 RepID=A0A369K971_HYPMA|nr:Serine/threonine-protein phosphatase 2B catalytic subunit [Hypsizygus marmoreus]
MAETSNSQAQLSRRAGIPPQYVIPQNVHERPIKNVPQPAANKPTEAEFFLKDSHGDRKPNPAFLKEHFFHEGRLTELQALFILEHATEMLTREPNLVNVKSPVTICGDIHGQYYDLMKLFEVGGSLNDNNYLFLGDYVDRGSFGIECLLYLYSLKLYYPSKFVLLRGNHECRHLTEYFTFKRECLHKYSERVYEACIKSFCALPVTALVDGRFFCVHGGISPELMTLSDLSRMNRFQEPGNHGLLCDLLWSDPIANYGHEQEPSAHGPGLVPGTTFLHNATRGCSFFFTYEASCQFLERNSLLGIIRGHEAQDAGYTMHRKTPTKKFPSVITIFSAPNYLDVYHNRGAVLKYANKNITIRQFNYSSHPYWLPNFVDAFTWSLPFVGAKITEMLLAVLSVCSEEELTEADSDSGDETGTLVDTGASQADIQRRRQEIKSKIMAIGKMQKVFQMLREESENATELVVNDDSNRSAPGQSSTDKLGVQGTKIGRTIRNFDEARRSDLQNERLPEFNTDIAPTMFPVPSMRRGSADSEGMTMEYLIKKTLEEEEDDGGVVERIAEKLARGRRITGRPSALKRHGTA